MVNKLREYSNFYTNIYVFVDGAAFGNQIEYLLTLIDSLLGCNICVFVPESFEYLLLNTSRFRDLCYNELLNTSDYVESSIYRTYENYFEDLLSNICNDNFSNVKYEKVSWNKLNLFFKQNSLLEEVFNQLIDIDDSVKCIDGIKSN